MIFTLMCANKRVHVPPQAVLDSEINVCFLLNESGDLYFTLSSEELP